MENDKRFDVVQVLCIAQLFVEKLDDIKDTQYYKRGLKMSLNQASHQIAAHLNKHINTMYETDSEMMGQLLKAIEIIVQEISTLDLVKIHELGSIVQQLKKSDD